MARLKRDILEVLKDPDTRIRRMFLKDAASSCWHEVGRKATAPLIYVSTDTTRSTMAVVHELLHYVLRKEMEFFDKHIEELIIDSLEWRLFSDAKNDAFRKNVTKSIRAKLGR